MTSFMKSLNPNAQGALLIVLGGLIFTLNDTLMKAVLVADVPLFQAILLRGLLTTALLSVAVVLTGAFRYAVAAFSWPMVIRIVTDVATTVCFLAALPHIPLAEASAIGNILPLAVTLAAAWVLKEQVGWRRYTAIAIGFVGVLLIVKPGTPQFSPFALLALASVGFVTIREIITRKIKANVPSLLVALLTSVATMATGGVGSLGKSWAAVSNEVWLLLFGTAVVLSFGYLVATMAMRVGEISFSAPYRYTSLVWAIIAGLVVFGEVPDLLSIFGILIIVASGIYMFHRERVRRGHNEQLNELPVSVAIAQPKA